MPFSKLKIILERITMNTWTEIVCCGNLQSDKTGKLSQCIQMLTCMLLKQSQKGFKVAKGDQVADICNGRQA